MERNEIKMTVKDVYDKIHEDYQDVYERFQMERMIQKYVLKFIEDPHFSLLKDGLENNDEQEAFRAGHTLKGVCANMGFLKLETLSSQITEMLRGHEMEKAKGLFPDLEKEYGLIYETIQEYKQSLD